MTNVPAYEREMKCTNQAVILIQSTTYVRTMMLHFNYTAHE